MAKKNAPWMKLGERLYAIIHTAGFALAFLYPLAFQINYAFAATGTVFNALRTLYHRVRRPFNFIPDSPQALIKNNEHHKASTRGIYNFIIFAITMGLVTQAPLIALQSTTGICMVLGNFLAYCSMTIFKNKKIHHLDNVYLPHAMAIDFRKNIIREKRYPKKHFGLSHRIILQALDLDNDAKSIYLVEIPREAVKSKSPANVETHEIPLGMPCPPSEPYPNAPPANTDYVTLPSYETMLPEHMPFIFEGYPAGYRHRPATNPEYDGDDVYETPPPFNPEYEQQFHATYRR